MGTPKAHERDQWRRWAALTPLERLRWLEEAKHFVEMAQGLSRAPGASQVDEPPPRTSSSGDDPKRA